MLDSSFVSFIESFLPEDLYPECTNEEVVLKFKEGLIPFEQVLLRYYKLLLKKSDIWVPGYTREELFQELSICLLNCCKAWSNDSKDKFVTYLYNAINNYIAWIMRKQGRCNKRKINYTEMASYEVMVENGYDAPHPGNFDDFELKAVIDMMSLEEKERICVNLLYEGHRKSEIAVRLGLTKYQLIQLINKLKPKFKFLLER